MVIDNNLTALGVGAGAQFIGTNNYPSIRTVLIGFNAGKSITTGSANVIVGVAGGSLTTGGNNTLVGDLAGNANVSGNYNTVMGPQAARFLLTSNNIMIGANAGDFLNDGSTHLTSPTNSIYLGFNAHGYSDTETNAIVIGNNALGLGSNTTVIGNSYTTTTALFGNVGIGTTNPLTALDIRGNTSVGVANTGYTSTFWNSNNGSSRTHFAIDGTSNDTILKFLDNSNNITGQWFTGTASMLFSAANSRSLTFETVGAYPMTFYTNSTGIGTMNNPRMTLDSSGNVGIGTTNPGKALDVIGEIRSSSAITSLGGGIFDNGGSGVFSSSNAVVNWGNINSGVNSALAFYTKNAEAMRIDPSGKVGIGNSSPTYKLDVMGTSTTDGIRTNIALDFYQVPPPPAPTLALVSGGSNLGIGTYYYEVIYTTALGQTEYSQTTASITTDSGDRKVLITVPVSNDARVTGRKIYRTTVGDAWYNAKLLTTIADNTTTSYTDDKTDASLGASIFYGSPNTTNNFITVTGLYAGVAGTYKALNLQPSNTTVGMLAGRYLGITSGNVLIGELAGGYDNLTGTSNTMVGESAGGSLNTGSQNTGIGYNSLTKLTGGQRNFAGGWNSLGSLTTGNYNTAIGTNAGYGITGTNYGIFLGNYAGKYETNANTLIIDSLDRSNQANSENNALIYGVSSATPSSQILSLGGGGKVGVGTIAPNYKFEVQGSTATDAIRSWSGYDIYEVPIPTVPTGVVSSGGSVDTGGHYYSVTYVTALGQTQGAVSALITTTAGNNTVTLTIPTSTDPRVIGRKIGRTKAGGGASSDYLLATINDNATTTYVDTAADSSLTTQQYATYIPNTTSKQITINGTRAMALDANLTAVGFNSGTSITNGFWNTFLGVNAGAAVSSGFGNTLFGWQAGRAIATGGDNVGIGTGPLSSMSSGSYNIGIGRNVGYYTNGSGNLFIGENSGFTTTGSYNIFLGYYSGNYETGSNKIIIDNLDRSNLANGESQALIYGVTNTTPASQILSLGGGGNVGINNISPHYSLDVSGTGNFSNTLNAAGGLSVTGTSTFNGLGTGAVYSSSGRLTNTDPSDINLKTNVADIGNSLSKIMQLRPVTFDWKDGGQVSQGFIAQEVETVIPELVGTVPGGYKGLYTTRFIPYIVKSIQEQQAEINSLLGGPSLSLSALNNLVLSGGLKVSGHVSFDADTVGEATVSAGQTEVIVNFSADYLEKPMITATPEADTQGAYWVSDVTAQSFKIKLHQAQANDVAFFWHAFAKKDDLLATTTPAIINGGSSLDNLGQDNQATTTSPADNSASTTSAAASSSTSTPVSSDASSVSGGTDASAVVPAVPAPAADSSISAPDSSAPASDASSSN